MKRMFDSAMGELTVAREGEGWIVLEDGRRVGGTLRWPFATREAAQEYIERELAGEGQMVATANVALSARARVVRETDAELWAKFVQIEEGDPKRYQQPKHAAAIVRNNRGRIGRTDLRCGGDTGDDSRIDIRLPLFRLVFHRFLSLMELQKAREH